MMAQTGYQVLQSNISYGKKQEERAARGIQELWKDWEKAKLKPNTHTQKKKKDNGYTLAVLYWKYRELLVHLDVQAEYNSIIIMSSQQKRY